MNNKESGRILSRKVKIAGCFLALGTAVSAWGCSGSENSKRGSSQTPALATPALVDTMEALPSLEVPTIAPTATTEGKNAPKVLNSAELAKTAADASEAIRAGMLGEEIPPGVSYDTSYADPDKITKFLEDCANRYEDPKYKNRPDYGSGFLASCEHAGRATKWWWEQTHKDEFLTANLKIRDITFTGFVWVKENMPQLEFTDENWIAYDNLDFIHQ